MRLRDMFKPSLKTGQLERKEHPAKHALGRLYCKAMRRVVSGRFSVEQAQDWVERRAIRHGL